jgi:hypothetical protein
MLEGLLRHIESAVSETCQRVIQKQQRREALVSACGSFHVLGVPLRPK